MLTPAAAAARAMPLLFATRCLMGCGEGTAYPCVQSVVKGWVPPDSRSRALTLIYSGGQLGTILALLTAPLIIDHLGWPSVFLIYGSFGFVWIALWQLFVSETPPLAHQLQGLPAPAPVPAPASATKALAAGGSGSAVASGSERGGGEASSSGSGSGGGVGGEMPSLWALPWRHFFSNKAYQAIIVAHGCFGGLKGGLGVERVRAAAGQMGRTGGRGGWAARPAGAGAHRRSALASTPPPRLSSSRPPRPTHANTPPPPPPGPQASAITSSSPGCPPSTTPPSTSTSRSPPR
jgi:MFS family permease